MEKQIQKRRFRSAILCVFSKFTKIQYFQEIKKLQKLAASLQESDIKKELTTFESLLKTEEDRLGIATRKRTSEEIEDNDENDEKTRLLDYVKNKNKDFFRDCFCF